MTKMKEKSLHLNWEGIKQNQFELSSGLVRWYKILGKNSLKMMVCFIIVDLKLQSQPGILGLPSFTSKSLPQKFFE